MKTSARSPLSPLRELTLAAGLLCSYYLLLPVAPVRSAVIPGRLQCLTVADRPPQPSAVPLLEPCSRLLPNDAELLADLGDQYAAEGQAAEAEAVYRRVLAIDPHYADVRRRLAELQVRS